MKNLPLIHFSLALLLVVGMGGVYAFGYTLVGRASAEAARLGAEIHTKSEETTRVIAAKAALASLVEDEAHVRQYLVRQEDIVGFLERLERTGQALGATVEVVSVSADRGTPRGKITLALKISGSFDSVLRTLGTIEYGAFDSTLTNLTFDRPVIGTEKSEWTAAASFIIGTQTTGPTTNL